jgi:uncharacterized membrane protein YraQ (UPF0718 family)/copper chaperone CopZ
MATSLTFLEAAWSTTLALAPWLFIGLAVAAAMHALVPQTVVARHLRGPLGVLKAVLLGIPLPLCSCSVIPAGLGLVRDGASRGAAVGFLVATPQTGVDAILVSASMLGWPFALLKVLAALVTGLAGGLLVERRALERQDPAAGDPTAGTPGRAASPVTTPTSARARLRAALHHARDIFASIRGWLVVGVLVSAGLTVALPPNALAGFFGASPALAYLGALAVAVPLYVCATGSVPIAAGLVGAGFPVGAALVFLMAGPATNIATVGAIRRAFGTRTTATYLGVIVVGSLAFALAGEAVLGDALSAHAGHLHHVHGEEAPGPLVIASGVLFLSALAWLEAASLMRRVARRQAARGGPDRRYQVDGMTCGGCVATVEDVVRRLDGVGGVSVDLATGTASVTFKSSFRDAGRAGALDDALTRALAARGFEASPGGVHRPAACCEAGRSCTRAPATGRPDDA